MDKDLLYQQFLSNGGDASYEEFQALQSQFVIDSPNTDLKKKVNPTENGNPSLTTGTPPSQTELPILKNPIPENEFNVPLWSEQDLSSPSLGITAETPSTDLPSTATVSSGVENSNPPQSLISGIESELRGNNTDFPMWRKAFDVIDANKANSENKAISLGDFQSTQNPFIRDINSTFQIGGMNLPMQETTLDSKSEVNPTVAFKDFNTTSEYKKYNDGKDALVNGTKQTNPYFGLNQLKGNYSVTIGAGTPNEKTKTLGSDVNGVFEDSTGKKVVDINGNLYDLDDYLNPERDFVESENNQLFNTNGVILTKNQKESDEGKPNVIDALYEFKPIELNTKTFNINNGDPSIVEKQNADLLQLEKEGKIKVYKNEKTDENGNLSWEITNPNFLKEYNDYNAKIYTPSDIDKGYNYAIQRNKILDPILQGARFETEAEDRFKEKFGVNAFNRYGVIPDSEMEQINDSLQKEQLLSQGYSEDQAIQFINQEKINSRQQEIKKGYDFIDTIVKPQLEIRASAMPDSTSATQRSEVEVDGHYQALRQLALNLPEKFNEFAESHKDWDFKKPEMVSAFKNAFFEYVKEDKAYQYAFNDHKIQQANLDVKKGAVNKDVIKVKESREKANKYSAQLEEQSQYFSQVSELKNEIDSNYFKSESEKTRKDREENRGYRENEAGAIATTSLKRLGDIPFRITGDWLTTGAALFGASNSTIKDLEIESKPFVGTRQQGITDDVVEYTDDKGNKYEAVNGTDLFYIDKNGQRGIATNDSDINSFISGNKLKETSRYRDFNGSNFLAEIAKVTTDMAVGGGIGKSAGRGIVSTLTKLKTGLSESNYARKGLDMLIASAANPNTTTSYAMAIQYYGGSYKNYQEKGYTNGEARALSIFSTAVLANVNRIFPDIKLFQESDQIALNTYRLLASGETSTAKKFLVGKFSEASKRIGGNVIGEVPEETIYEPFAESIVQYIGASISGDRKKLKNIDSPIDFSADTVGLTIGTVLLSGAFGTGKANIDFNKSTPLEKSIFLSKNPEYVETLHNLKNDAIVGESAKRELSAYYTIEKFVDKIPSDNNLNISQTADVVTKLQKIDALKKEIDKSDIEAFKTDIQGKINVLNADISTILEQSKTQQTQNNESPNAETAQPTPQSEAVQEQTTETEKPEVATQSEQPTITGEQNIPSELNPTQDGQTTVQEQGGSNQTQENVQPSNQAGQDTANQLPEMGQGIAQYENATQEVAQEEVKPIRQLGTGDNVYFESEKHRLNESQFRDKPYILNIGDRDNVFPRANIEFSDLNEAKFVAEKVDKDFPKGMPDAILVDKYIDQIKQEYQNQTTQSQEVDFNEKIKKLGNVQVPSGEGNWREAFNNEKDIFKKATILRAIADISKDKNELSDIREASKGMPDESNIINAVDYKEKSLGINQEINEDDIVLADDTLDLINSLTDETAPSDNTGTDGSVGFTPNVIQQGGQENNPAPTIEPTTSQGTVEVKSFPTKNSKYTINKNGNSFELIDNKTGKPAKVSDKTKDGYFLEIAKSQEYPTTEIPQGVENEIDYNAIILSESKNPKEIANVLLTMPKYQNVDGSRDAFIANNINRVSRKSFLRFSDENNITIGLAKAYFAKSGEETNESNIDNIAKNASFEMSGGEDGTLITPQEVIDFILENRKGAQSYFKKLNPDFQSAVNKFVELTGVNPTLKNLNSLLENTYNEEAELRAKQQAEKRYDAITNESRNKLANEYDEYFNSLTLEEQQLELQKTYPNEAITNETELKSKPSNTEGKGSANVANKVSESPEYKSLIEQRDSAEKEVANKKAKLDSVSKSTNQNFQADQENLFGDRATTDANALFDERANGNAGQEVIAQAKSEYNQARAELNRINNAIRDFENGKVSGTESIDFENINSNKLRNDNGILITKTPSLSDVKILDLNDAKLDLRDEIKIVTALDSNLDKWDKGIVNGVESLGNNWYRLGKTSEGNSALYNRELDRTIIIKSKYDSIAVNDIVNNNSNLIVLQSTDKAFTPIPQSTYDKLVKRLLGVFKKFGGKVITDFSEFKAKAKELGFSEIELQNIEYRMDHTAPVGSDGFAVPISDLSGLYPDDVYSNKASLYYGDGLDFDSESASILQSLRDKPNKLVTVYRAVPDLNKDLNKDLKKLNDVLYELENDRIPNRNEIVRKFEKEEFYTDKKYFGAEGHKLKARELSDIIREEIRVLNESKSNPIKINSGDWVTINKKYAILHGQSNLDGKYKIVQKKLKASQVFTDANSLHEQGVEFMKTPNGEIYGAKLPDGTIYLNPEKVNANTPIHEFSHLWQQLMPTMFKKGVELLKNTPIGKKTFAELKANEGYANKSDEELWDEALVTVMGNEGERIFNSPRTSKFKEWLVDLFKKLGNAFGIRDLSPNDKLSTFVKGALSEVMGTKEIIPESSVEQKEVPIYIKKMTNADLRTILDRLGLVIDAVCP